MIQVVGADPVAQLVGFVDTTGRDRARRLGSNGRLTGMRLVPFVVHLQVVVEAHHVELFGEVGLKRCVHGGAALTRGIQFV